MIIKIVHLKTRFIIYLLTKSINIIIKYNVINDCER